MKQPEKYEMIAHSWKLTVAGKQVCNTCGLVALNNDFTRWAMDKGCMNHLHPDFKMLIVVILNYLIKEINMTILANSPAPAIIPFPQPYKKPCIVDLEEVLQVLKREGADTNLILAVKEMELYS